MALEMTHTSATWKFSKIVESHPRRGFTLLELLISVMIVAALFALLLSGYQGVKRQAVTTGDLNNLRQIGVALHTYLGENRFKMPPVMAPNTPGISGPTYAQDVLARLVNPSINMRSTNASKAEHGIWISPGDRRKPPYLSPIRSYAVNYYAGEIYTLADSTTANYYHEINTPSRKIYFLPGEGQEANPDSQARFSPSTRPIPGDDAPGSTGLRFDESGKAPALWIDGHASIISKAYLRKNAQALLYPKIPPPVETE